MPCGKLFPMTAGPRCATLTVGPLAATRPITTMRRWGGDCTSFASQCLYAGIGVMDYTPDYGWYYLDANNKAPAWTGVEFFYRYLTQTQVRPGPYAVETSLDLLLPGDFVQLSPQGEGFTHTAVVVQVGARPTLRNTLVAAHSYDVDRKPLSNYAFRDIRYLHILGGWRAGQG